MALTPEQLMYYTQAGILPQQAMPDVSAYAQPPMQATQPPMQPQVESIESFSPPRERQRYVNLIEQRFQELAQSVGGVDRIMRAGMADEVRQKAMKDVELLYGPYKEPVQPMQVQPIPGTNRIAVSGGGFSTPQLIEAQQQQSAMQLAPVIGPDGQPIPGMGMTPGGEIKTYEPASKAAEMRAKAASENIGLASDVLSSVDSLLSDENALQWAGGMTGSVLGRIPGQTSGIRQKIEQLRDQIGLFGRKAIVGQGQGSISDAEQKMAKEAMAQIVTEGTDEQLINSLKAVRQKFGGILDRIQSESGGAQPQQQPAQSSVQRRVFVPGKGFQ
jgi:hypothetical protein